MKAAKIKVAYRNNIAVGIFLLILLMISAGGKAQGLVINEFMSSNSKSITDEDGESSDWIELYNSGNSTINLEGFSISDSGSIDQPWTFPEMQMSPKEYLLLFASDMDRREPPLQWETVIDWGDEWSYLVPDEEMPGWKTRAYDDSSWEKGTSGFGYGDNDDNTVLNNIFSVFIRKFFTVNDPADVQEILLHMDYDDGFVAYINGKEVARANITSDGPPLFDQFADNYDHEAAMFQGGQPDLFVISDLQDLLKEGENVLAIQIHNANAGSSDLTAIPFLSLGRSEATEGVLSKHLNTGTRELHTNFKLTSDGEFLLLIDASGNLMNSVFTRALPTDISLGRKPDGEGEWQYFQDPTPGDPNNEEGYSKVSGEVTFSKSGGMYSGPFQLELSTTGGGEVYYTTDGSSPQTSGDLYTVPIPINETTVVRAQVINDGSIPGPTGTNTYFINADHEIPVISVTTPPENLWDYNEGIYVKGPNAESANPYFGANFWQDWEKSIHIEMYEPDGELAFAQNAGVKIFGNYSRANDQKSLSIFARKSYGSDRIAYQVFPGMNMEEFSSLVLRNSGNDWNNSMMRDALLTSLFHDDVDKQAYRPAVVYINGEYWGIQNIREKVNEDFLADHHDLDPDSITILENYAIPVEGDDEEYLELVNFITNNSLTTDESYQYVKERIDIFNFIQYQIGNIYIDNKDWPGNNIKYWKADKPGAKWRWISYDTDFGFDIWNEGFVSYNTMQFAVDPYGPDWPNPPWSTLFLRRLLENTTFRNEFINAFADRLNTALLPVNVIQKIDDLAEDIEPEINRHLDRWEGSMSYWESNISRMRNFASERPGYVRQHLRSQFGLPAVHDLTLKVNHEAYGQIQVNTLVPESYPWEGTYFQGVPVKLKAIPQPGYKFLGWVGDFSGTEVTLSANLIKDSDVLAVFGEEDSELNSVVINEINYNSSDDFDTEDWVELYNKGDEAIDMSGWVLKDDDDTHEFLFAEGTILESGKFLVVCRDQEAFSSLVSGVTHAGDMDFGLSGDGDCVRLYNDQLVLTDEVCYQSGSPWPASPNGQGATLALKNPTLHNAQPENWYALTGNGNPGENNETVSDILIIDDDAGFNLSIFPNPVDQDLATVSYLIRKAGQINLNVYDTKGRLIKNIYDETGKPGRDTFTFRLTPELKPGVYFIEVRGTQGRSVIRFVRK